MIARPRDPSGPRYRAERKSVLMVTGALARGGAERQMISLVAGLLREGYHVRILELQGVAPGQSSFKDEIAALGVPLHHASEFPPSGAESGNYGTSLLLDAFASILPPDTAALAGKVADAIRRLRPS